MSIISLQYANYTKQSQINLLGDSYRTRQFELPSINRPDNGHRFIQTHELWGRDSSPGHTQIRYDTTQLTDSLVCFSMSTEIRRTLETLTQQEGRQAPPPDPPREPIRLAGSTKLFGKSLFSLNAQKKTTPESKPSHKKRRNLPSPKSFPKNDPLELDLTLSPVTGYSRRTDVTTECLTPNKKETEFRLPYRECLTKSKSPTVQILEVECLSCGQFGSIYRHRVDKSNCGRCGNNFAIKLENKVQYKFRVTKEVSSQEIKDRLRRHGTKLDKTF